MGIKATEELLLRLLHGIKIFHGCSQYHVTELLSVAERVDIKAGQKVVEEGERSREFYVVISGEFSVSKRLASGKQTTIAHLKPGDSFGEMSYLDGRPRSATVVANSDAILLSFERQKLAKIPESAALVYMNLAGLMALRIRDSNLLISLALDDKEHEGADAAGQAEAAAPSHQLINK